MRRRRTRETFLKAVARAKHLKKKKYVDFKSTKISKSQAEKIYFVYKNLPKRKRDELRRIAERSPKKAVSIAVRTFNDVSRYF